MLDLVKKTFMSWRDWFRGKQETFGNELTPSETGSPPTEEMKDQKGENTGDSPKYLHPKILSIDTDPLIANSLKDIGYNVSEAILGKPYSVDRDSDLFPVRREYNLPHDYKEHEIAIIDLHFKDNISNDVEEHDVDKGINAWWASHQNGYINPRPLNASLLREDFDRILNTGGIFVVFSDSPDIQEFLWGHKYGYGKFRTKEENIVSNWGFLRITCNSAI